MSLFGEVKQTVGISELNNLTKNSDRSFPAIGINPKNWNLLISNP